MHETMMPAFRSKNKMKSISNSIHHSHLHTKAQKPKIYINDPYRACVSFSHSNNFHLMELGRSWCRCGCCCFCEKYCAQENGCFHLILAKTEQKKISDKNKNGKISAKCENNERKRKKNSLKVVLHGHGHSHRLDRYIVTLQVERCDLLPCNFLCFACQRRVSKTNKFNIDKAMNWKYVYKYVPWRWWPTLDRITWHCHLCEHLT